MGLFQYCVEGTSSQSHQNRLQKEIKQKGPRCLAWCLVIPMKGMVLAGEGQNEDPAVESVNVNTCGERWKGSGES